MSQKIQRITVLFFLLLFFGTSSFLFSQAKKIQIQRINLTQLPQIQCYFTVTDEQGNHYLGIAQNQMAVSIDGVEQNNIQLISAIDGGEYLAIALLFDRSGSMKSTFDMTKNAAVDFVQRMSLKDEMAVISFDDIVRVDTPFTTDKELIINSINGISMGNNTALYDALKQALTLLEHIGTNRQAIVVFSDGKDTRSQNDRVAVYGEIQKAGVPLYFIGLGEDVEESSLKEMSEGTGGHFFRAGSPEEILLLYQKIAEQLQNQYSLSFPSTFGEDEEWHTLDITFKEFTGSEIVIQRKYQATKGPGISRAVVAGFERQDETNSFLISIGLGVFAGFLCGLLIVLIIKITRPETRLLSVRVIAVLVCTMFLGGILGVLAKILSTL